MIAYNSSDHLSCLDLIFRCFVLLSPLDNPIQNIDVWAKVLELSSVHVSGDSVHFGVEWRVAKFQRVEVDDKTADLAVRIINI